MRYLEPFTWKKTPDLLGFYHHFDTIKKRAESEFSTQQLYVYEVSMTDNKDLLQDIIARTKASLVAKQSKDMAQKPVSVGSLTAEPIAVKLPLRMGATKQPEAVSEEVKQDCKEDQVVPFPKANRVPQGCWVMTPDIIRSAIFAVAKKGKEREFLKAEKILAVEGMEIEFTGERLDQADMDVFMHALSLSKEAGLGARVFFSRYAFLKALGKQTNEQSYQRLVKSLKRLRECSVTIDTPKYRLGGGLIDTCAEEKETGRYYLRFNPEISKALQFQTFIPSEGRLKLGRSELSKWLYSYILSQSTYKKPHTVWSYTLQGLTGSNSCIKKFNQNIKKAFETIEREIPELLESWSIVQGKIQFKKKPYSRLALP